MSLHNYRFHVGLQTDLSQFVRLGSTYLKPLLQKFKINNAVFNKFSIV